ncbi:MAG: helix-turn-helix domain-containing protein [Dehalococcoidia bacterium]|nr:helix-turn-helix domain-containing protein [Dehalococcoidia bacterium]
MNPEREILLSIGEASKTLGVSEAALRQWTDDGKIKAFVTPGGHRRYSTTELKRFLSAHQKTLGLKDVVTEIENTATVHREIFQESIAAMSRFELDKESREHFAELGRNMLGIVVRYITEPSKRDETLSMARTNGRGLGEMLAKLGFTLTDSVEAFISHRDPMIKATTRLIAKKESFSGRVVETLPLVVRVLDEALVSLVNSYQEYTGGRTRKDANA